MLWNVLKVHLDNIKKNLNPYKEAQKCYSLASSYCELIRKLTVLLLNNTHLISNYIKPPFNSPAFVLHSFLWPKHLTDIQRCV